MKKIILAISILAACVSLALHSSCSTGTNAAPVTVYRVKYEVTGTGTATSIVYTDSTGDALTIYDPSLPWTCEFSRAAGRYVGLSVVMNSGTAVITIYKNGSVFQTRDCPAGAGYIGGTL